MLIARWCQGPSHPHVVFARVSSDELGGHRNVALKPDVKILVGDCLESLRTLPEESVHCVVTSPPYWGLRDYGVDGQIGLEPTFDEFLDRLVAVFEEVRRVLRKDGTCWVNLGSSYASCETKPNQAHQHSNAQKCGSGYRRLQAMITQHPTPIGHFPRSVPVSDDGTTLALFVIGILCLLAGRRLRGISRTK